MSCKRRQLNEGTLRELEESIRALKGCSPTRRHASPAGSVPEGPSQFEDLKSDQFYVEKLKAQRQRIQTLREQYSRKEEAVCEKQAEADQLRKDLQSHLAVKRNYEALSTDLQKQGFELKALKKQRQEFLVLVKEYQKLGLKQKGNKLKEQVNSLTAHNQALSIEINRLQQLNSQAKAQKAEVEDSCRGQFLLFKEKWDGLCQQAKETRAALQRLEGENSKLQSNLNNLAQEYERQQEVLKGLRGEGQQSEGELGRLEEEQGEEVRNGEKLKKELYREISEKEIVIKKLAGAAQKQQALILEFKKREKDGESRLNQCGGQSLKSEDCITKAVSELKKKEEKIRQLEEGQKAEAALLAETRRRIQQLEHEEKQVQEKELYEKKQLSDLSNIRLEIKRQRRFEVERIDEIVAGFRRHKC